MNLLERQRSSMASAARWGAGLLLVIWLPGGAAADAIGAGSGAEPALAQLHRLIGDAACRTHEDCRTIAVGAKACGGPDAYLAWSARRTDAKALVAAATRYAELRRLQNEESGRMSNCVFVSDPGARCEAAIAVDAETPSPSAAASAGRAAPLRCLLNPGQRGLARPAD
jgi:hypothetical protein